MGRPAINPLVINMAMRHCAVSLLLLSKICGQQKSIAQLRYSTE